MEVVQRMIMSGMTPRDVCRRVGLELPEDMEDMEVLQTLLGCLRDSRRERKVLYSVDGIVDLIRDAKNILVLTGAGISVSCGIPDFRSKDGLYAKLAVDFPELPDPQVYYKSTILRRLRLQELGT
jgi:NAD-dependent deacetylase sirtuin 1